MRHLNEIVTSPAELRAVLATAIGLVGPFLTGFDTHGVPFLLRRYVPLLWAFWFGAIRQEPLLLISAVLHVLVYITLMIVLLEIIVRVGRRKAKSAA
jgi:hypothetical protein